MEEITFLDRISRLFEQMFAKFKQKTKILPQNQADPYKGLFMFCCDVLE